MSVKSNDGRIAYLDVIRAASMILVVYCHYVLLDAGSFAGNVIMTCAWVGVPCFMMVSGALMHRSERFVWKKYLFKILTAYLVLAAWKVIYLLVYVGLGTLPGSVWQIIQYVFFFGSIDGINTGVMWYMTAYLIVLLIYPVTHFLFRKAGKAGKILVLFLMILTFASGIFLFSLGWVCRTISIKTGIVIFDISGLAAAFPFTNYACMIFYFLAGAFLLEYRERILEKKALLRWISAAAFVIGVAGLLMVKYADASVWTWAGTYIADGYRHISTLIASIGFYVFLSLFEYNGFFLFLGRTIGSSTLGIYYMHYIVLAVCSRLLYPRLPEYFFGMNLLKTLLAAAFCAVITYLIGKIPIVSKLVK